MGMGYLQGKGMEILPPGILEGSPDSLSGNSFDRCDPDDFGDYAVSGYDCHFKTGSESPDYTDVLYLFCHAMNPRKFPPFGIRSGPDPE